MNNYASPILTPIAVTQKSAHTVRFQTGVAAIIFCFIHKCTYLRYLKIINVNNTFI